MFKLKSRETRELVPVCQVGWTWSEWVDGYRSTLYKYETVTECQWMNRKRQLIMDVVNTKLHICFKTGDSKLAAVTIPDDWSACTKAVVAWREGNWPAATEHRALQRPLYKPSETTQRWDLMQNSSRWNSYFFLHIWNIGLVVLRHSTKLPQTVLADRDLSKVSRSIHSGVFDTLLTRKLVLTLVD